MEVSSKKQSNNDHVRLQKQRQKILLENQNDLSSKPVAENPSYSPAGVQQFQPAIHQATGEMLSEVRNSPKRSR